MKVNLHQFLDKAGNRSLRIVLIKQRLEVCKRAGDKLDNILAVKIAADELMHEIVEVKNLFAVDGKTQQIDHIVNKGVEVVNKLKSLFSCPKESIAAVSENYGHCQSAENGSGVCIFGKDPAEVLHLEFKLPEIHHVDDAFIVLFTEELRELILVRRIFKNIESHAQNYCDELRSVLFVRIGHVIRIEIADRSAVIADLSEGEGVEEICYIFVNLYSGLFFNKLEDVSE